MLIKQSSKELISLLKLNVITKVKKGLYVNMIFQQFHQQFYKASSKIADQKVPWMNSILQIQTFKSLLLK
jgi:hypothetical protein